MNLYRRIIDDLARRLESGTLKAGERVPSTRALARKWKVANVTAARALSELARSGLVKALPRSGYVVASNPKYESKELSRERIVKAAVRIADEEGLEALSIRGVATRVNAPVMSLYRHVRSKDELVMLMADAVFAEVSLPKKPLIGWRSQLELSAGLEWRTMCRHPWLARVMHTSRPITTPHAFAFVDWVMRALDETTLDAAEKLQVHVLLHGFIQGLAVNVEAEAKAVADTGTTDADYMREQDKTFREIVETGQYPYFGKMARGLPKAFKVDLDALFRLGLNVILDGIAVMIDNQHSVHIGSHRRRRVSRSTNA
jgi:DNA-binding transcriptional regulator YhcF (GntR family)